MKFLDSKLNISLLSVCKMCKLYQANMIYDNFLGLYYLSTVYKLCKEEVLNVHLWKWKGYLDLKKINTCTCVNTFYHIYKLWCYTGISGSEKSHNNTHEKTSYFFTCVDTANQLLTCHLPLAPLSQVDEWTAKPSWFLIKVLCWSFLELWRLKH